MPDSVGSFSLRSLRSRLPSDGATRFIKVSGVPSSMSHIDVCELLRVPPANRLTLRWDHCCPVLRTDFVVELPSVADARQAMQHVNSGITFLESRLTATYTAGLPHCGHAMGDEPYVGSSRFETEPMLYYALPSQADRDVAQRRSEAEKKILNAPLKPRGWWVNERSAE